MMSFENDCEPPTGAKTRMTGGIDGQQAPRRRALWLMFLLPAARAGFAFSPVSSSPPRSSFRRDDGQSRCSTLARRGATPSAAAAASDEVCTVQILMSDTGGGHRASANALRDAFDVLHPGKFEVDIVDLYTEYGPFWPYNDYVEMYKRMAANPWSWEAFYRFGSSDFGMCVNAVLLEAFCFESFAECLSRPVGSTGRRADMVVSVHPLCQDVPLRILPYLDSERRTRDFGARTTPFCTVVTDLGSAHPTWFHPSVDKCFVPSDALHDAARRRGLAESQIVQHGLPIRRGFWYGSEEEAPASIRRRLGLEADLPTVLVVGGGDGMGGIVDIARALGSRLGRQAGASSASSQMVVVCGKNDGARRALERDASWGSGVRVHVKGFVDNMDEWMKASDALVTKAGPGTIAEASICGLPCMMFSYLPGQEEGNIPYVEDAGFGAYSGDPAEIAGTVAAWLSSPERLRSMRRSALAAARPRATLDIAGDLAEIAFAAKERGGRSPVGPAGRKAAAVASSA